jgi:hypothetical protein
VGIGTTSALHKLHITQAADGNFPTLGTGKGALFIAGDTNLYGMYFGVNTTSGDGFIQTMRNNTATAYNLILNSAGGNVGIGTTSPTAKLTVRGPSISPEFNTTTVANASILISNSDTDYGTFISSLASGVGIVQQRRYASAVYYDLSLNPYGGNVGIGTSSPSNKLEVNGTVAFNGIGFNTNAINTTSTSARIIRLTSTGGDFYVGTESSTGGAVFPGSTAYAAVLYNGAVTPMQFWTGGTLRMTLDTSGNLGIGTSSPTAKLQVVSGNIRLDNNQGLEWGGGNNFIYGNETTDFVVIATNGTERIRIDSSGNLGIGTSSPSALLTILGPIGSVNDSAGTMRLATTYSTSGSANALGAGIVFAQRYFNSEATAIRVGGIYGIKTEANGNFGGGLAFYSQPGSSADMSERMRLDHLGNLGLGVTPSAWSSLSTFQASRGSFAATTAEVDISHNAFYDGAWKYIANGFATNHYQANGEYIWRTAASGTAGNTISFTQAMTLTAAGVLCVGVTSNTSRGGGNTTLLTYKASGTNYLDIQCGSSGDSGLLFSTASSGNYGLINYRNSAGDLLFYTTSVERMRLTATGLGITEANNPTQAFNIYRSGSTQVVMAAGNSGTGLNGSYFGVDTAGNAIVNQTQALATIFSTSGTERMRLDSSGNLGIGSTAPAEALEISRTTDPKIRFVDVGNLDAKIGIVSSTALGFEVNGSERVRITSAGHFRPAADNTYNLGEAAFRWANIYTADLNLSNRDSQNDVDGTWGEWTIQEGENDLYLINRRNGKKFKFMLKEVE